MRPEEQNPPEIFYNDDEAEKYAYNSRIQTIQTIMTERAIEMLVLPADKSCFILDIGCGSGLSGDVLSEHGHTWIGYDISPSMLGVASDREVEGDLLLADAGNGLLFRPGVFDGAISISVLQWLCNADKKGADPFKRLCAFFSKLYAALKTGSRAVFQFYPDNSQQTSMITAAAMRSGFGGGIVVDYPNSTRAKKIYLCLFAGFTSALPRALSGEEAGEEGEREEVRVEKRVRQKGARNGKVGIKSKEWIIEKKQRHKMQGKKTASDSKYTGRKRPAGF